MDPLTFVNRVKKYFGYLEFEYGFKVLVENNSNARPETDGVVKYASNNTLILIDSETGYASVRIARIKDGERYYLTPVDIHEYLNTVQKEKELLLSTESKNQPMVSALSNSKFLLNQPGWKGSKGTVEDLDKELKNFSVWLKQHADLCLKGDFSKWAEFYEYKIARARADHLRRGKDELGFARVKDADGNWKLIKQSIFKDKLEHVEKLKKEFSK